MRVVFVYLIRFLLAGLGSAAVLRFCYGPATPYDRNRATSFVVVCAILAACAVFGWLMKKLETPPISHLRRLRP